MKIVGLFALGFCCVAFAAETPAPVETPVAAALRKSGLTLARTDDLWGFRRFHVTFEGWDGWIVEPKSGTARPGNPWVWCMKWPGAFAEGSGQIEALRRGYHYVYLDNVAWMSDAGVAAAKRWRDALVKKIGLAEKAYLIGMSWGGFYSTRYAAAHPADVAKIYLDNPLMGFHAFPFAKWKGVSEAWGVAPGEVRDWRNDPRMPINLAKPIAAAKIPVLLLYGDKDVTCVPSENCLIFLAEFQAAGGQATVFRREGADHHPHGYVGPGAGAKVFAFFEK